MKSIASVSTKKTTGYEMPFRSSKATKNDGRLRVTYDLDGNGKKSSSKAVNFDHISQITVSVRLRSLAKPGKSSLTLSVDPSEKTIYVERLGEDPMPLRFSRAFGPNAQQAHIYRNSFAFLAEDVTKGAWGCAIATGPTGGGKTFTFIGELGEFGRMGVVPRLGSDILDRIACDAGKFLTLSCYETGGGGAGRVRDLLSTPPVRRNVLLSDQTGGSRGLVEGLLEPRIFRLSDLLLLLERAQRVSTARAHSGHTVFILGVHTDPAVGVGGGGGTGTSSAGTAAGGPGQDGLVGAVALIDLCAPDGFAQGCGELSGVLTALAEGGAAARKAPWRGSVVSQLLWPFMRPPARTAVLVAVGGDSQEELASSAAVVLASWRYMPRDTPSPASVAIAAAAAAAGNGVHRENEGGGEKTVRSRNGRGDSGNGAADDGSDVLVEQAHSELSASEASFRDIDSEAERRIEKEVKRAEAAEAREVAAAARAAKAEARMSSFEGRLREMQIDSHEAAARQSEALREVEIARRRADGAEADLRLVVKDLAGIRSREDSGMGSSPLADRPAGLEDLRREVQRLRGLSEGWAQERRRLEEVRLAAFLDAERTRDEMEELASRLDEVSNEVRLQRARAERAEKQEARLEADVAAAMERAEAEARRAEQLRRTAAEMTADIEAHRVERSGFEEERACLAQEVKGLQADKKELQRVVDGERFRFSLAEARGRELEAAAVRTEGELAQVRQALETAREKGRHAQMQEAEERAVLIASLKVSQEAFERDLNAARAEAQAEANERAAVVASLRRSLEATHAELMAAKTSAQLDKEALRTAELRTAAAEAKAAELEEALGLHTRKEREVVARMAGLEEELKSNRLSATSLQRQLQFCQEENKALAEEASEILILRRELQHTRAEAKTCQCLQEELDSCKEQLSESQVAVAELQRQLTVCREEKAAAMERCADLASLNEQLATARAAATAAQKQVAAFQEENKQLLGASAEVLVLRLDMQRLTIQNEAATRRIAELERDAAAGRQGEEDARAEVARLDAAYRASERRAEAAVREAAERTLRVAALEELNGRLGQAAGLVAATQGENRRREEVIRDLTEERAVLLREKTLLRQEMAQVEGLLRDELASRDRRVAGLTREIELAKRETEAARREAERRQGELRSTCSALGRENTALRAAEEELRRENEALRSSSDELVRHLDSLAHKARRPATSPLRRYLAGAGVEDPHLDGAPILGAASAGGGYAIPVVGGRNRAGGTAFPCHGLGLGGGNLVVPDPGDKSVESPWG